LTTSVRRLFEFVTGLFAARAAEPPPAVSALSEIPPFLVRAAEPPPAAPTPVPPDSTPAVTPTMSAFIARIRQDTALRARFAQSPGAVLREFGIDPTPFNLLNRLNDAQIQALLNDWTAGNFPAQRPYSEQQPPPVMAHVSYPVYGPPPSPRRP
jgi:hypothetical protein